MAPMPALQAQTQEQAKGQVIDKIIAKVDDYIVLKSELERAYLERSREVHPDRFVNASARERVPSKK